jgi:hypothetical protein
MPLASTPCLSSWMQHPARWLGQVDTGEKPYRETVYRRRV